MKVDFNQTIDFGQRKSHSEFYHDYRAILSAEHLFNNEEINKREGKVDCEQSHQQF